jgi:hypothetical protein
MVRLDDEGYRAALAADFLARDFGRVRGKAADSSAAGMYTTLGVAGRNTLVELFARAYGLTAFTSALVFSFEEPGSSLATRQLLDEAAIVEYDHQVVYRAVEGTTEKLPWYDLIRLRLGDGSPLLVMLNEVRPSYLAALGGEVAPDDRLRRRDYLDVALGAPFDESQLLLDITGVTLNIDPTRAKRLTDALSLLGFTAVDGEQGPALISDDFTIRLRQDRSPEGIVEISMALTRELEADLAVRFGKSSVLTVEAAGTARWEFTPEQVGSG